MSLSALVRFIRHAKAATPEHLGIDHQQAKPVVAVEHVARRPFAGQVCRDVLLVRAREEVSAGGATLTKIARISADPAIERTRKDLLALPVRWRGHSLPSRPPLDRGQQGEQALFGLGLADRALLKHLRTLAAGDAVPEAPFLDEELDLDVTQ